MKTNPTEKYFIFILLLIVLVITFLIVYPFLSILILAGAFSVALRPIYNWIKRKVVKKSWAASAITVLLFLAFVCIPLFFMGKTVVVQVQDIYAKMTVSGGSNQLVENINTSINKILPDGFNFDVYTTVTNVFSNITSSITKIFSSILSTLVLLLLTILVLFYLLKDGDKWQQAIIRVLPLSDKNTRRIFSDLRNTIQRILRGSLVVMLAQGVMAWVGYTIFGIPNAITWALLAAVTSLVPTLGSSLVTVPVILYLFSVGMSLQAVGLLLWHLMLIAVIDNIINPYIVSHGTPISTLFIILSVLGSILLMGPVGIIMGPLVMSLLYSMVSIYKEEMGLNK